MYKQLFLPQRYLQSRHEVITPTGKRTGRREWIISRGLCHYRLFVLTDIPTARRESVLQLKIKQWSPFQDSASYPVWQGGRVQVWVWDKQLQQQTFKEIGLKKATILPETVLRARATTPDGIQLFECLEGVEGQIWQDGVLKGSRWWSQIPSVMEWVNFQRVHGLPASREVPPVLNQPLLERPWGRTKTRFERLNLYQEPIGVILGAAVFITVLTWQAVDFWKWQQATKQLQEQSEELNDSVVPLLTARNQALADRRYAEQLLAFNPYPSQLEVMAQIAQQLPRRETRLLEWTYQMGELRFTLETSQLDPTFYVKTFQAHPWFNQVQVETGRRANQIMISMQLES